MLLLTELNAQGMTVVIVTHESDIAKWARRKLVFRDGEIVEDVRQQGGPAASQDSEGVIPDSLMSSRTPDQARGKL
jgi:energy-coupling factor transporter ATP-binding protein EcfA2